MRIGFRDTDKPVKTLILDEDEYRFTGLLLHEKPPVWTVLLDGGGCLVLYFTNQKCFVIEDYQEVV